MKYKYQKLHTQDSVKYQRLMSLFADVFDDRTSYQSSTPSKEYISSFLDDDSHIVLVALTEDDVVIGGLVAYELQKFEQERRELYIYDLAVAVAHQRQHVGTGLIDTLKQIAQERGAHVIFVQADEEDLGAISFYRTFCTKETQGSIFDIKVESK